ncbi:MAG: YbbR-like domain-containing protein [Candidatus Electrothrix sp. YB6]
MDKPTQHRISRKHCRDWMLKLFSLCLGVLVWFLVVGTDQMDMSITVPLEVLNLPKDLVIYNQYQKEVLVTLRGPRTIMQELRNRNTSVPVDLSKAKPDTIVLNTDRLAVPLPSGISILRIQPASITLSIDQLVEKQIPISAVTDGEVSDGYMLKNLTLAPDKILVSGPQKIVSREEELKTYLINLNGLSHSATFPVHLDLTPDFMELIGETTVVVKLTVAEKFVEKKIRKIPINIRDTKEEIRVKPDSVSVVASIPKPLIEETPELAMLFRASVSAEEEDTLPCLVPVTVNSVSVPNHEPIRIISQYPLEVEISAVGTTKKETKKETKQDKQKKTEKAGKGKQT